MFISSRGNEAMQQKYEPELTKAKTLVSDFPLEYIEISPINDGKGVHMCYILSKDMKMDGMEKTIAGKQKDFMKANVDKIKKAIK